MKHPNHKTHKTFHHSNIINNQTPILKNQLSHLHIHRDRNEKNHETVLGHEHKNSTSHTKFTVNTARIFYNENEVLIKKHLVIRHFGFSL
jgi:hypothetical protein